MSLCIQMASFLTTEYYLMSPDPVLGMRLGWYITGLNLSIIQPDSTQI